MTMDEALFRCLRCGHEYKGPWDKKVLKERTCPKCASNSVRRVKGSGKEARKAKA